MKIKNKRYRTKLYPVKEGYDLYAENYDKTTDFLNTFENEELKQMIGDVKGKKVLDVGCGTGRLVTFLKEKNAEITGCDISDEMLIKARKKFPGVDFVNAEAKNLPFENNSFDLVIMAFVIVHIKDLQTVFDEIYRVLKPGGCFILTNINQRKAPKLRLKNGEEIVIESYYHLPEHLISSLNEAFFVIREEKFLMEDKTWINQLIYAVK